MSKLKSKPAKPAPKSKPIEKSKPKPKPAAKPALPSMTPNAPIHGTVSVIPGTSASVVAPGTSGLVVNGREEKETLALTIRLPRSYRTRIDDIATESGVSVNALFQQLFDRYGTKVDLGPRLDAVEGRLAALEGRWSTKELIDWLEVLPKAPDLATASPPVPKAPDPAPASPPEMSVQAPLSLLPAKVREGFVDMYFARLPAEHFHKFSVVLKYLNAEQAEIEVEDFGETLEKVYDNLLTRLTLTW